MARSSGWMSWARFALFLSFTFQVALIRAPLLAQGRQQSPPPASSQTLYDPDLSTCDSERIRTAFQQQLQPFADQGDAVLAYLRQIQLEMTAKTLSRCVSRQLLSPEQAAQLSRELAESPTRP